MATEIKYDGEFIVVGARKYTNKHELPKEIVRAILKDRYTDAKEDPFDESASTLIAPIQLTILKRRHPDKLKVHDVTDCFWQFMGSVAHQVLEDSWHESMTSVVEERIYAEVEGRIISGKLDCYDEPEIRDYKTCKVYKIMKGGYEEWEKGQNIYAYLLRRNEKRVEKLNVWAMIFDWKKSEAFKPNYPKSQIAQIPLRLWSFEEQEAYVRERVRLIKDASCLPEGESEGLTFEDALAASFPCSKKDMWQDISDVAIMKDGAKRAFRKFETTEEAERFKDASDFGDEYKIVERWTRRTRCFDWCEAAPVCQQHKQLCKEEGVVPEDELKPCLF